MRFKVDIAAFLSIYAAILITACPVPENNIPQQPVNGIVILRNQTELNPADSFEIREGEKVILSARLLPAGITGGIHWQSSALGIVQLSGFSGEEITITGTNGGRTTIRLLARNIHNQVYAEAECSIMVIPSSFFKWNYIDDGWFDLDALNNAMAGKINKKIIRSGETPILADPVKGGLVLTGPGTLTIGSGLSTPTNYPFSTTGPLYDIGGTMDFFNGPFVSYFEWEQNETQDGFNHVQKKKYYPLWKNFVKISVDYETDNPQISRLRIQVNNNTHEKDNASAITNWLVAELPPGAPASGTLYGIFNSKESELTRGVTGVSDVKDVLSNSFISLVLPAGSMLIRGIRIESVD